MMHYFAVVLHALFFMDLVNTISGLSCEGLERNLVTRAHWGAKKPNNRTSFALPVCGVMIHHTSGCRCDNRVECSQIVRDYQEDHLEDWDDIGYHFLIGEDGNVYEGRGWDNEGAHSPGNNDWSYGICFIGNFMDNLPNSNALEALDNLLECGISQGKIHPEFKLYGHRDGRCTDCPGTQLYQYIQGYSHYSYDPITFRCTTDRTRDVNRTAPECSERRIPDTTSLCIGVTTPFVRRSVWGARRTSEYRGLPRPVCGIFIHHAGGDSTCSTIAECSVLLRTWQRQHLNKGWKDLGYNFAIDPVGRVYEGPGWSLRGTHAPYNNHWSYGVLFIGNFVNALPTDAAFRAFNDLMQCGISEGYISPSYKLYGHRDGRCTICPGDQLYARIQTFEHYSNTSISSFCDNTGLTKRPTPTCNNAAEVPIFMSEYTAANCDEHGDILRLHPNGASPQTATNNSVDGRGVGASNNIVSGHVPRLTRLKDKFDLVGMRHGIHPALLAAIASKVSNGGALLDERGYGTFNNETKYGIMQSDSTETNWNQVGPDSLEHINQFAQALLRRVEIVDDRFNAAWTDIWDLQGGIVAHYFGDGMVQTQTRLDIGTTNDDFTHDIIARAQHLIRQYDWRCTVSCKLLADLGDCEFFRYCIQRRVPCGPSDFTMAYGYRQCLRLKNLQQDAHTPRAVKELIPNLQICLMRSLYDISNRPGITCQQFTAIAINRYPACLDQNGVCTDTVELDRLMAVPTSKANTVFEKFNKRIIKQFANHAWRCDRSFFNYERMKEKAKLFFCDDLTNAPLTHELRWRRSTSDTELRHMADMADCAFWEEVEEMFGCKGRSDLGSSYTLFLPLCEHFKRYTGLTATSQIGSWMERTQRCLMNIIQPFFSQDDVDCLELEVELMGAVADCMVDAGFCSLEKSDEFFLDRALSLDGFPYKSSKKYVKYPLSGKYEMLDADYFEGVDIFRSLLGVANSICHQRNLRSSAEFYTIKYSPAHDVEFKVRTEN